MFLVCFVFTTWPFLFLIFYLFVFSLVLHVKQYLPKLSITSLFTVLAQRHVSATTDNAKSAIKLCAINYVVAIVNIAIIRVNSIHYHSSLKSHKLIIARYTHRRWCAPLCAHKFNWHRANNRSDGRLQLTNTPSPTMDSACLFSVTKLTNCSCIKNTKIFSYAPPRRRTAYCYVYDDEFAGAMCHWLFYEFVYFFALLRIN